MVEDYSNRLIRQRPRYTKHGHTAHGVESPTYTSWRSMLSRCYNPRYKAYIHYGGRGIYVCGAWQESFLSFLLDMGERPYEMTLERRDNDGPYSPDNCYWASMDVQANNKRVNVYFVWDKQRLTLAQWEKVLGIPYDVLRKRYRNGWTTERILTTPVFVQYSRKDGRRTHCKNGHILDEKNTYINTSRGHKRFVCRKCQADFMRNKRSRR